MIHVDCFKDISIRGRIAYVILCFERYVEARYPKTNWNRVDDFMWRLCDNSDFIDNTAYQYMEIIPEYLYEFSNFEDAEFEYLSKEDYDYFKSIIPVDDDGLNTIMHAAYSIAMEYAYVALEKFAPETLLYINNVLHVLEENQILAPDINLVSSHQFDEADGWGHAFDGRYLSSILNAKSSQ